MFLCNNLLQEAMRILRRRLQKTRSYLTLVVVLALSVVYVGCQRDPKDARLPVGSVDSVTPGMTIKGIVPVMGWAADNDGIREVCLYIDRQLISCTTDVSVPRPDVANVWPGIPGADKSGWQIQLDTSAMKPGPHDLVVQARSNSRATRDVGGMLVNVSP